MVEFPDGFPPVDPAGPLFPIDQGGGNDGTPRMFPAEIQRDMGDAAPYSPPPPLPYPQSIPKERVDDFVLVAQKALQSLLGNRFSRDKLQAFLQETVRQQFQPVHLAPWVAMPIAGSQMGDTQLASPAAGATATLVTLNVPNGSYGVVRWLGQDTQNDAAGAGGTDWANLSWSILIGPNANQLVAIPGFTALGFQLGQIEAPTEIFVFVPSGWTCVLQVRNTSGVLIPNVAGHLRGWHWPVAVRMSSNHVNAHVVG